jgi:hypothetical protein
MRAILREFLKAVEPQRRQGAKKARPEAPWRWFIPLSCRGNAAPTAVGLSKNAVFQGTEWRGSARLFDHKYSILCRVCQGVLWATAVDFFFGSSDQRRVAWRDGRDRFVADGTAECCQKAVKKTTTKVTKNTKLRALRGLRGGKKPVRQTSGFVLHRSASAGHQRNNTLLRCG